jgi:signal transduction histidine kinase
MESSNRHPSPITEEERPVRAIAHDLNNVLGLILSYATFVAEEVEDESPAKADVKEILVAGERAAALVRELLAVEF